MPGKRRWLSLLLVASIATFGMGLAVNADSATESEFISLINSTRAANGLAPLTVDEGLRAHAHNHTQEMIDASDLYHSASTELRTAAGSGWSKVGENVGRGGTATSLHSAFMNSPTHAGNVLGTYNYVGVGTGNSDGRLYVTVVFMQKGSTPSPTTTQPAQTTTTSPETTTTTAPTLTPTTTSPATTTTTEGPKETPPTSTASTTTTTTPTTTTTLVVGPDKAVTPGESCVEATRYGQICHD